MYFASLAPSLTRERGLADSTTCVLYVHERAWMFAHAMLFETRAEESLLSPLSLPTLPQYSSSLFPLEILAVTVICPSLDPLQERRLWNLFQPLCSALQLSKANFIPVWLVWTCLQEM